MIRKKMAILLFMFLAAALFGCACSQQQKISNPSIKFNECLDNVNAGSYDKASYLFQNQDDSLYVLYAIITTTEKKGLNGKTISLLKNAYSLKKITPKGTLTTEDTSAANLKTIITPSTINCIERKGDTLTAACTSYNSNFKQFLEIIEINLSHQKDSKNPTFKELATIPSQQDHVEVEINDMMQTADGRILLMTGNRDRMLHINEKHMIYVVNPVTKENAKCWTEDYIVNSMLYEENGIFHAAAQKIDRKKSTYAGLYHIEFKMPPSARGKLAITERERITETYCRVFSASGNRRIILTAEKENDKLKITKTDLSKGKMQQISFISPIQLEDWRYLTKIDQDSNNNIFILWTEKQNIFVSKHTQSKSGEVKEVFRKYFGGEKQEMPDDMAILSDGSVCISAATSSKPNDGDIPNYKETLQRKALIALGIASHGPMLWVFRIEVPK